MTSRWRALAAALLASSLLGAIPAAAQSAAELAIQDVIQRANSVQTRAIASRDPSAMAETAVGDYFRQLARTNQDLLDAGVSNIQLVSLEWGPISIDGSGGSATATTFETWRTSYAIGPTEFTRD